MFNEINEINEKSKVKINQINSDINLKFDELFNLFLENNLTSNELNIEKIEDFAPKRLVEKLMTNNPIKFKNPMDEIKKIVKWLNDLNNQNLLKKSRINQYKERK